MTQLANRSSKASLEDRRTMRFDACLRVMLGSSEGRVVLYEIIERLSGYSQNIAGGKVDTEGRLGRRSVGCRLRERVLAVPGGGLGLFQQMEREWHANPAVLDAPRNPGFREDGDDE